MPHPIPDHTRAAILTDIRAGTKSRAQIARDHNVSRGSVTNIATEAGQATAFDRTATKNATQAVIADNKARRAALATLNLADDNHMRTRARDAQSGRDARDYATAYGIFIDKHLKLVDHDSDTGAEGAKSMLGALVTGLRAVAAELGPDDDTDDP